MITYNEFKKILKDSVIQRKLEGVDNIFIDDRKMLKDYIKDISKEKREYKMLRFILEENFQREIRENNIFKMNISDYMDYIISDYNIKLDIFIDYIEIIDELQLKIIIDNLWEILFKIGGKI